MNILMLLSNPFIHDYRVYNEAKSLIKASHRVTILAWDRNKKYQGRESKDGIKIIRSHNTKFMNLLPLDIIKLHFWWKKGVSDALNIYQEEPFDAIHCHDLDTLPIGVKLKKILNVPLIYDAHEIWGYMVSKNVPWWRYYIIKENRLLKYVDHMIITNSERKKIYENKVRRSTVIDNYKHIISKEYVKPLNYKKRKLSIVYIGSLLETRFLLELIEVVGNLEGVTLNIGGKSGELYLKIQKESMLYENVNFLGMVSEIIPITLENDVIFIMISISDKNDITASTNKQYEAMVCGRPIICTKGTFVGNLTEKENVGIVINENKEELKKAIIMLRDGPELRENLGKNALKSAINRYNWDKQEEDLLKIYEDLKCQSK